MNILSLYCLYVQYMVMYIIIIEMLINNFIYLPFSF